MRCLFSTTQAALFTTAADAKVKVIVVGVASRWFVEHPGRAQDRARGVLVARRVSKQAGLELIRAEEPLHAGVVIHDEGANEVPIPSEVEREDSARKGRESEAIEWGPSVVGRGETASIASEEEQVGVAPSAMTSMARMRAASRGREIADPHWIAARKARGDFSGRSRDSADQGRGAEAGGLASALALIALPPVRKRDGISEVAVLRAPHGDRLPGRQRLDRTRADRQDPQCGEKPKHSICMIAHGSA